MCKSISEGGQRCAAHTRAAYFKSFETHDLAAIDDAAKDYASTNEGRNYFADEIRKAAGQPEGNPPAKLGYMPDYDLRDLTHRGPNSPHYMRYIEEGDSRRRANQESAEKIRGANGDWSDPPTNNEILGYIDQQAATYEYADAKHAEAQMADALATLNADEPNPENHVTSFSMEPSYNANGELQAQITDIEVNGEPIPNTHWRYTSIHAEIVREVRPALGNDIDRMRTLSRETRRNGPTTVTTSTPTGQTARWEERKNAARDNFVAAQHVRLAGQLIDEVHSITYQTYNRDQTGHKGGQVRAISILDANGNDASEHWPERYNQHALRGVLDGDSTFYLHDQKGEQTVTRDNLAWRPNGSKRSAA